MHSSSRVLAIAFGAAALACAHPNQALRDVDRTALAPTELDLLARCEGVGTRGCRSIGPRPAHIRCELQNPSADPLDREGSVGVVLPIRDFQVGGRCRGCERQFTVGVFLVGIAIPGELGNAPRAVVIVEGDVEAHDGSNSVGFKRADFFTLNSIWYPLAVRLVAPNQSPSWPKVGLRVRRVSAIGGQHVLALEVGGRTSVVLIQISVKEDFDTVVLPGSPVLRSSLCGIRHHISVSNVDANIDGGIIVRDPSRGLQRFPLAKYQFRRSFAPDRWPDSMGIAVAAPYSLASIFPSTTGALVI